jgi:hypothetical protein
MPFHSNGTRSRGTRETQPDLDNPGSFHFFTSPDCTLKGEVSRQDVKPSKLRVYLIWEHRSESLRIMVMGVSSNINGKYRILQMNWVLSFRPTTRSFLWPCRFHVGLTWFGLSIAQKDRSSQRRWYLRCTARVGEYTMSNHLHLNLWSTIIFAWHFQTSDLILSNSQDLKSESPMDRRRDIPRSVE